MTLYDEIKEWRTSAEAKAFADNWLAAQRNGQVSSDYHMNLLAWTLTEPHIVLAITLNLIDQVGADDDTAEMVALGPVQWLVEHTNDDFTSALQDAIADHTGFALYTKGMRAHSTDPKWIRLNKQQAQPTAAASPSVGRQKVDGR